MRPERHTGIRQPAQCVILINFTHKTFQFPGPFLRRCQPPLFLFDVAVLLAGLGLLHFSDKRRPVRFGKIGNRLEHPGNQVKYDFFIDAVLGGAERSNGDFAVLSASVLMDTLAVVGAVDIHFPPAISTIHQPCQRCGLAPAVRVSLDISPDTLHVVKGFLVDDSVMGVLEC